MAKNLILGLILAFLTQLSAPKFFSRDLLLLVVRHCSRLTSYVILRKPNEPNLRLWQKTLKEKTKGEPNLRKWQKKPNFAPDFGQFGPKVIQSWENLVTDRDGQTDESDFIGCCPINVKNVFKLSLYKSPDLISAFGDRCN